MPILATRGGMSARGFGQMLAMAGGSLESFAILNRGNPNASNSYKYFIDRDAITPNDYLTSGQRGGICMSNADKLLTSWGYAPGNLGVSGFNTLVFASNVVGSGDLLTLCRNGMGCGIDTHAIYNTNGASATASAATYKYTWSSGAQAPATSFTAVANIGAMVSGATKAIAVLNNITRTTNLYTYAGDTTAAAALLTATPSNPCCGAGNAVTAVFSGANTIGNNQQYNWASGVFTARNSTSLALPVGACGNAANGLYVNAGASANIKKLNYASDVITAGINMPTQPNAPTGATNGISGVTTA